MIAAPPAVPEIRLWQATEVTPLWQATEAALDEGDLPPPYWAFAWVGGQALARFLLDNRAHVAGRTVFDLGAGSGLVGLAAAMAGARAVTVNDTDPYAAIAMDENAQVNGLTIAVDTGDRLDSPPPRVDVITAGDLCYERPMARRVTAWLAEAAAHGSLVLLADPGRSYRPRGGLIELAQYRIAATRELEDKEVQTVTVFQVTPQAASAPTAAS